MYRLISIFTYPGEVVLDCFNGAGTTSLTAEQLGRKYICIEKSEKYYNMTLVRHEEIHNGLDPFRKEDRILTSKNSRVPRMPKQKYDVPKKMLQLEVKRVASLLGRKPTRDDIIKHGKYPIKYYDNYFLNWGEVCAAARTTGMSERRKDKISKQQTISDYKDNFKLKS
jgi:site-specific DNA-methyltransferase (adenine-specific)